MVAPEGAKATPTPFPEGSVAGLAYFAPKPADQGYAEMAGEPICAAAIVSPEGENATLFPVLARGVLGLAYFAPNPADQGYATINGESD